MVSDSYKVVFVHINKTAGTSIGSALGLKRHHRTASMIRDIVSDEIWNSYFKFAFVRNPWDRMVSMYEYRVRAKLDIRPGESFEEWIWTSNEKRKKEPLPLWGPQTAWFSMDGENTLDFIGRFENIKRDWEVVCSYIGQSIELPRLNVSERRPYQTYYNSETKELVSEWHKEDIEMFGYRFQELMFL